MESVFSNINYFAGPVVAMLLFFAGYRSMKVSSTNTSSKLIFIGGTLAVIGYLIPNIYLWLSGFNQLMLEFGGSVTAIGMLVAVYGFIRYVNQRNT